MESKVRIKFKEVHHSNLWGLKLNLFSSKVSNKDSVKVLDKLHKDMEVNECKKRAKGLADVSITLHNWKMKNFKKDKMYGSKKVLLKFKLGLSAHAYYDEQTGKWQKGDEKNVKVCISDLDVESSGGKTFLMKLAGGLTWLLNPFEDWLAKKFVVPMIRKTVFCSIVNSPPAIFTGLARKKMQWTKGHIGKVLDTWVM